MRVLRGDRDHFHVFYRLPGPPDIPSCPVCHDSDFIGPTLAFPWKQAAAALEGKARSDLVTGEADPDGGACGFWLGSLRPNDIEEVR